MSRYLGKVSEAWRSVYLPVDKICWQGMDRSVGCFLQEVVRGDACPENNALSCTIRITYERQHHIFWARQAHFALPVETTTLPRTCIIKKSCKRRKTCVSTEWKLKTYCQENFRSIFFQLDKRYCPAYPIPLKNRQFDNLSHFINRIWTGHLNYSILPSKPKEVEHHRSPENCFCTTLCIESLCLELFTSTAAAAWKAISWNFYMQVRALFYCSLSSDCGRAPQSKYILKQVERRTGRKYGLSDGHKVAQYRYDDGYPCLAW